MGQREGDTYSLVISVFRFSFLQFQHNFRSVAAPIISLAHLHHFGCSILHFAISSIPELDLDLEVET